MRQLGRAAPVHQTTKRIFDRGNLPRGHATARRGGPTKPNTPDCYPDKVPCTKEFTPNGRFPLSFKTTVFPAEPARHAHICRRTHPLDDSVRATAPESPFDAAVQLAPRTRSLTTNRPLDETPTSPHHRCSRATPTSRQLHPCLPWDCCLCLPTASAASHQPAAA